MIIQTEPRIPREKGGLPMYSRIKLEHKANEHWICKLSTIAFSWLTADKLMILSFSFPPSNISCYFIFFRPLISMQELLPNSSKLVTNVIRPKLVGWWWREILAPPPFSFSEIFLSVLITLLENASDLARLAAIRSSWAAVLSDSAASNQKKKQKNGPNILQL